MLEQVPLEAIASELNEVCWDVLSILNKRDEIGFSELRQTMEISQQKCAVEIAKLKGALLIKSRPDPKDSRAILYTLTEYGVNIMKYKNI